MSKSLGTGIDPLKYVEEHGADATRFAVLWQASGQDIRWDESAVFAGRKFCNKIWNASRFVLANKSSRINADLRGLTRIKSLTPADKKILKKLSATKKAVEGHLKKFEFSKPLHEAYDFFWHDFCDKYLEASKSQIQNKTVAENTKKILLYTLGESLKMLHPFMPFITEEIWQRLPKKDDELLMITPW